MIKSFIVALSIVYGIALFGCSAKKPRLTKEEIEALEAQKMMLMAQMEALLDREPQIVYVDTIIIDNTIEIPIYDDCNRVVAMPEIYCENPADYIGFAFYDTDKSKYYCATGRGESSSYSEAKHAALEDAVLIIREEAGNGVALGSAELLMTEEDRQNEEMMKALKEMMAREEALEKYKEEVLGLEYLFLTDEERQSQEIVKALVAQRLNALKESENVHKVVVAIRIPK